MKAETPDTDGARLPWLSFPAAIMLGLAQLHWSMGYYHALRWVVFLSAVALVWSEHKSYKANGWIAILIGLGILFNPIVPVHLGSKEAWRYVDIGAMLVFLAYGIRTFSRRWG